MKAIILVAGMGGRLGHLTSDTPKCLVEVNSRTILENALECLNRTGIQECVLVVGHLAKKIKRRVGNNFKDIKIIYVTNEIFKNTGNIYSLWLAEKYLRDDIILLEGDIFFESEVIEKLCKCGSPDAIVVDDYAEYMDGTAVVANDEKTVEMILKKDQDDNFQYDGKLKTVNIYKFSMRFMENCFIPTLNSYIGDGYLNEFYELVISKVIKSSKIQIPVLSVNGLKWFEIDTYEDLKKCEKLFGDIDR